MPAFRTLAQRMIDYLALTIGHGLLALAFWHLFLRDSVDRDPLLDEIRQAEADNRKRTSNAGRNAARRADVDGAA
ncbi:hypothetical protein [Erythrobacter sp. THAF29]|uniref:hypothetical protein n=1 Tax=Erythrobacter sp. THAF29 TaxID=2587851 RepID=UPI001F396BF2|nr:hypothetical protein [Erythrobacter sp. THAF29]